MRKSIIKSLVLALMALLLSGVFVPITVHADEELISPNPNSAEDAESEKAPGTNISLSPVSKVLQISSNSQYEDHISVTNDGDNEMQIEVYAAPYSYIYSEEEDTYKLGFNNDNSYTQITRWITFKDKDGNYAKNPTYTIAPKASLDVYYKISTPDNIPAGGQYAVIFAHTLTGVISSNGIKTEASPGMVVFGRSTEGETITKAVISGSKISQSITTESGQVTKINASAKIKNEGNVDFSATGKLTIDGIIGGGHYETPANAGRASVIPESELAVSDTWEETPSFGIFKVVWTVNAGGETETIEQIVVINIMPIIIIIIILLTIIAIWIIIVVRKRKERRSRFAM